MFEILNVEQNPEEISAFRNRILKTSPSERGLLVLKPHAFADEHFTRMVLDTVQNCGFEIAASPRVMQNEAEVDLLHTILTIDDQVYGNGWKVNVYAESLSGPFYGIGLIGAAASSWSLEYKRHIRDWLCPSINGSREIVRNFIHTPDDIGDDNPQEFVNTVDLFFPEIFD